MNIIKLKSSLVLLVGFSIILSGCNDRTLRGSIEDSKDKKTYLKIVDNNGGHACSFFKVDGKKWNYKINEAGEISPGLHRIECGGEIEFEIPEGVVFSFDYWGP